MKTQPEGRAVMLGRYIIENRTTVRGAAGNFGISKSTVHKDVSERLKQEDPELYEKVKDILEINKKERHIRGGLATKRKYAEIACRRKKIRHF
ncbi:putative DeoR family transcriptional regulator, stage III sporulation protein D [Ruminococcus flavefaciens]|uniref:Putative DeoR family transcriptional regulator, stage III sporulation protein D n=1 Tax=Ruminococcus flavefaciens TaxID=1265 RepID=A0A1H6IB98_RUMFL|nr:sporulation transcriptional regulator SpoIIID [Ruminococcus flavefaciens]SEH45587.1 putative DeoR family transcriptional regulator, stage III sporulation protein D [Ruminococcus flavefaciens]